MTVKEKITVILALELESLKDSLLSLKQKLGTAPEDKKAEIQQMIEQVSAEIARLNMQIS